LKIKDKKGLFTIEWEQGSSWFIVY